MLRKLIKYEFRAQTKETLSVYALVLVIAVIGCILKVVANANPHMVGWKVAAGISMVLLFVGIIGIWMGSFFMALLRFRKNLLKDEGYLMHTLPVTENQLVLAKILTAALWAMLHAVYTVCVLVVLFGFSVAGDFIQAFTESIPVTENFWPIFIIEFLILLLGGYVTSINQIQMSLSIGYRARENKDAMAVVAFIVSYVCTQIIAMVRTVLARLSAILIA